MKGPGTRLILAIISTFAAVLLAAPLSAASVYKCSPSGKKCIIKLESAGIGDHVRVVDERSKIVAKGRIVRIRHQWGVIFLTETNKNIRPGYPVLVESVRSTGQGQWVYNH